jgi:hypothetical protein
MARVQVVPRDLEKVPEIRTGSAAEPFATQPHNAAERLDAAT